MNNQALAETSYIVGQSLVYFLLDFLAVYAVRKFFQRRTMKKIEARKKAEREKIEAATPPKEELEFTGDLPSTPPADSRPGDGGQ